MYYKINVRYNVNKKHNLLLLTVFFEEQIEVDLISLWNVLQPIGFGYSAAKIEEIQ